MHIRPVVPLATLIAALAASGAVAHAAPRSGETLELSCERLGTVDVVVAQNNPDWTPGFVVGSNVVVNPYRFSGSTAGYADGTEGPEPPDFVETWEYGKPGPRNGRTDSCDLRQSFVLEDGTLIVVDMTVQVSYTKR